MDSGIYSWTRPVRPPIFQPLCNNGSRQPWTGYTPFHGGNRGSNPLGDANKPGPMTHSGAVTSGEDITRDCRPARTQRTIRQTKIQTANSGQTSPIDRAATPVA